MSYDVGSQNVQATIADMSSTGDKVTLTPVVPVTVVSFGFIVTTAIVGALVMKCDKRPTAGSDTGRGDGDLGTLTLSASQGGSLAAGDVARCRPAASSSFGAGPAPTEAGNLVLPGEQAILELTTGATSGAAIGFIEFKPADRLDRATTIELLVTS